VAICVERYLTENTLFQLVVQLLYKIRSKLIISAACQHSVSEGQFIIFTQLCAIVTMADRLVVRMIMYDEASDQHDQCLGFFGNKMFAAKLPRVRNQLV